MKHQKTVEQDVFKFIKRNDLFSGGRKLLIGLSGGADSVFALHFFIKYSKKYKIDITAVHINHNLRGDESYRDFKFSERICAELNIEFHSASVDVKSYASENKKSVEESAREVRYREFERVAKSCNADIIVTAHNNDDNTETVLLNIVSGAGLKGISGIPVKRNKIIRPFLCVSKSDIISYLKKNRISFFDDSSNDNIEFKRNFIRKKIIPLLKTKVNPSIDKVVLTSSEVLRKQRKVIEFFIDQIVDKCVIVSGNKISLTLSELKKYPQEVLGEVFKNILFTHYSMAFTFSKFEKIKNILESQVGVQNDLGQNVIVQREREILIFYKKVEDKEVKIEIEIGQRINLENFSISLERYKRIPKKYHTGNDIEFISGDSISDRLVLRTWQKGDRIQLLGMQGTKKISDVLTDLKIPSYKRKNQLVLVNNKDKEIVWIVGKRISEKYKVTEETKSIIKLCLN